jgi:hypothetical protein
VREIQSCGLLGIGAEQQPALVDRPAGNTDFAPLEVGDRLDAGIGADDQPTRGVRMRREGEIAAECAAARNPEPVRQDDVDRAALKRHRRAVLAGELDRRDDDAMGAVEPVAAHDVEFPVDGAEFEDADAHDGQFRRVGRHGHEHRQQQRERPEARPRKRPSRRSSSPIHSLIVLPPAAPVNRRESRQVVDPHQRRRRSGGPDHDRLPRLTTVWRTHSVDDRIGGHLQRPTR